MSYTKITSEDLVNKGVTGLADTPGLSTTEMQEKFDELSKDVIVPKFNNLVDELDASNIDKKVESETITNVRLNEDNNIEVSIDGGTTYKQTSSSGHIIMDGTGRSFPQRSRLQYSANTIITDVASDNTTFIQVPSGVKGDKGDSATITVGDVETSETPYVSNVGSKYDAIFNFGIPKGEDGSAATVQVGTVTSGDTASVSNRGTSANAIFDFVLPKGEKGDSGTSFQVLGTFATYEELIATHPVGNRGDAYAVGDETSNVVYNWNNDTQAWDNLGALKGVKGDDGKSATITIGTVSASATPTVENVGTSLNAILNFGLQKGDKGDAGNSATIAVGTVEGGDVASVTNVGTNTNAVFDFTIPKGDKGDSGDPAIVNGKSGESIVLYGYDIYLKNYTKAPKYENLTDDDNIQSAISKLDAKSGGGAKIIIATDEDSIGNTFTCAKGDMLFSDIADSSLEVVFNVPDVGTWTVINVEASNSVEVEIPYFGVYRKSLGVGDVNIVIEYSEEYIGYNFSITNGTKTKTKTATGDLTMTFVVAEHETWTISNTLNEVTKTVNATEGGTYNVAFGVAPAYNYQGWLDSAEITETFASLDEVLADEKTVRTLMSKNASADYLYGWYEADATILDTIIASANAMKWLGLRDYVADKFLAVAEVKTAMLESDNWEYILKDHIPIMTSDSNPYGTAFTNKYRSGDEPYKAMDRNASTQFSATAGERNARLGYEFVNPIVVNRVVFSEKQDWGTTPVVSIKIVGSNDNSDWSNVLYSEDNISGAVDKVFKFDNDVAYKYIAIEMSTSVATATCYKLQFYGREKVTEYPNYDTRRYIYDNGIDFENFSAKYGVSLVRNDDYIEINGGSGGIMTDNMIDVSAYNIASIKLADKFTTSSYDAKNSTIAVGTDSSEGRNKAELRFCVDDRLKDIVVDISNVNENVYSSIWSWLASTGSATLSFREWYLE